MRPAIYPEGLAHCRISRDGALCYYLCFGRLAFGDLCSIYLLSIKDCVINDAFNPRPKLVRYPGYVFNGVVVKNVLDRWKKVPI